MAEGLSTLAERIRKCLALVDSPNEGEAAAAAALVQKLLLEHNLSMADIEAGDEAESINLTESILEHAAGQIWKANLIAVIARNNFCFTIRSGHRLLILGRDYNVSATVELATWIIPQLERLALKSARLNRQGISGILRWRNSFLTGASVSVVKKLRAQRVEQEVASSKTALVVRSLSEEAKSFAQSMYSFSLGRPRVSNAYDRRAYDCGVDAGNNVSLSSASRQLA